MTVEQLQKALRGVDPKAIIVCAAHDAVTGKASSAYEIDEDLIDSWNSDTGTQDFHKNMFVISS